MSAAVGGGGMVGGALVKVGRGVRVLVGVAVALNRAIVSPVRQPRRTSHRIPPQRMSRDDRNRFTITPVSGTKQARPQFLKQQLCGRATTQC